MMIETSPDDLAAQPLTTQRSTNERNGGESGSIESARALAKGVLDQAAKDLRKFRAAREPLGRELYRDAYSWVMSNDLSWPYSFVNVCEALGLSTEVRPCGIAGGCSVRLVFAFPARCPKDFNVLPRLAHKPFSTRRSPRNRKASLCGRVSAAQIGARRRNDATSKFMKTKPRSFGKTLAQNLSATRACARSLSLPEHDALQLHGQLEPDVCKG